MERRPRSAVLTGAVGVVTYTLAGLRVLLPSAKPTLDFTAPPITPGDTLFFEAFVTGTAKGVDHSDDTLIAAREAQCLLGHPASFAQPLPSWACSA